MRQLTALDAQFLHVETATTAAHVAGLAILDSADGSVTRDALADLLLARLHLSPALSLRVAEVPLGLDHPYWVSDPDFDIDNHLFETTLPLPGDDWQLADAVAEIHARRLDRAHPLWEMHLINGLENGRVAVYTKVHHAAIDGVSGAETLAALLDLTPDGHLRSRDRAASGSRTRPSSRTTALRAATPSPATPASISSRTTTTPPVSEPGVPGSQAEVVSSASRTGVSSRASQSDVSFSESRARVAPPASRATAAVSIVGSPHSPAQTGSTTASTSGNAATLAAADAETPHTTAPVLGTTDVTALSAQADVPPNGISPALDPADVRTIDIAAIRRSATPPSTDTRPSDIAAGSAPAEAAMPVPADERVADVAALPVPDGAGTGCVEATDAGSGVAGGCGGNGEVVPVDKRRGGRRDGDSGGGDGAPGLLGMLAGAAVRTVTHPVRAARSVVRAAGDLDAIPLVGGVPGAKLIAKAARMVSGERHDRPEMPRLTAPRTPFNGAISGRRHLSFGSLSLKDVKKVAKANGISVNDVVMALCTSALRAWLRERDALPEAPLVVAVPVAVRTGAAKDVVGNQISAMVAPLPTNLEDPGERLQAVGDAMAKAKRRFAMAPATWPSELCSMLPAPVTSLATPAIFRLAGVAFPPINLIISNVPGPQFPLYLCGGRLLSYYPMSVLTDLSGGLSITCFSYDGMVDFGLVACPERVDDVWSLVDHLRTALDELLDERVGDEFRDGLGIDLVAG